MTELEEFESWCAKCGHYAVPPLLENFRRYREERKQRETEALQKRAGGGAE